MKVLDSNIWIAFLNKKDSQHQKAVKLFDVLDSKVIIPEYIILEVCSILVLKVNKETADNFLKMIFLNKDVEVLFSDNFLKVADFFISKKIKKLSFIDIFLLYLSDDYEVLTFDKDLQKAIKSK